MKLDILNVLREACWSNTAMFLQYFKKHSYKKRKYTLKTRAVFLMFCLNFRFLIGRPGNTTTQQKWLLTESIFSVKMLFELKGYFSQFLLLCQCSKASGAVSKINTDQKHHQQYSLSVVVYIVQSISSKTVKRVGY